jgi:hypothetical protein
MPMSNLPDLWLKSPYHNLDNNSYNLQRWLHDSIPIGDAKNNDFQERLNTGFYGKPCRERIALIVKIKEVLEDRCASGESLESINGYINKLSSFFRWINSGSLLGKSININTVEKHYYEYAEHLYQRTQKKSLKPVTAYGYLFRLAPFISPAIGENAPKSLINRTRISKKMRGKRASQTNQSDKQDLEKTFLYCEWLYKVVTGIAINDIYGQLPTCIDTKDSYLPIDSIEIYFGKKEKAEYSESHLKRCASKGLKPGFQHNPIPFDSDLTRARQELVNFAVLVQSQFFIAATEAPNPSVVYELVGSPKKFIDNGDTFMIKGFKRRKGGEYHCEIYKDFKQDLKRYLVFRDHFFPTSDLLFPVFKMEMDKFGLLDANAYKKIKNQIAGSGIEFIPPKKLRATYSNWLKRRSGDENLTADAMNHSVQTFRQNYHEPNQQKAMTEVARFWKENDFLGERQKSIIASDCDGNPEPVHDIPSKVVKPNCVNPSGCLWCKNHRDIPSFDYVWSLVSFRKLKTLEILVSRTEDTESPLDLTIERINQKIKWFRDKDQRKKSWVEDSEVRMEEGDYHPNFLPIIEILES